MSFKKTFLPAVILALICLVCALALAVTNRATEQKIAESARAQYLASAASVMPEGTALTEIDVEGVEGFFGKDENGHIVGYVIKTASRGYGGDVSCVVGFDAEGRIIGLSVAAPDETPGLGSRVADSAFSDGFLGKSQAPVLGSDVDAVTGATYSSRAVTEAVAEAFAQLEILMKGA